LAESNHDSRIPSAGSSWQKAGDTGQAFSHLDRLPDLYSVRFSITEQARKRELWRVLCQSFFQKYVKQDDAVVDLGAGFCEFINLIRCRTKYAVDLSPDAGRYASSEVRVLSNPSYDLAPLEDGSVDVVFASNFFEHLRNKDEFLATLREVHRVLRPESGRLLILQPNIRLLNGAYWDFVDHHLPLTERTLIEALQMVGLTPIELRTRFLPYTTKSRFPQHRLLIKAYVRLRPLQWLLGKQTWVVAVKRTRAAVD
jgi:SAM-dependent methyltransferase